MGSAVSFTTHANVDGESGRGHSYTDIVITDNARVHNGDVYNIRNFYGAWPDAVSRESQRGATLNPARALVKRKRSVCDLGDKPARGDNPFLSLAINQLGEFATSVQHHKQDEAAQRIVSWIRVIVEAVGASATASPGSHTTEEVARMHNGLLLTNRVGINSVGQRNMPEQVVRATRRSSLIIFDKWKIALDTTSLEALDEDAREVTVSFSALRLTPLDLANAAPVAAFFGERTDHLQSSMIHPTIFAYRTVSSQSEVFKIILEDDITGLVLLLAEQKATIRDIDEKGRSLLHYACWSSGLKCCTFLIKAGAEVDGIAKPLHGIHEPGTPLLSVVLHAHNETEFPRPAALLSLLLDAGADPNAPCEEAELNTPLYVALDRSLYAPLFDKNVTKALELVIRGSHVALMSSTIGGAEQSILLYAFAKSSPPPLRIVKELLNAGCDIDDTAADLPNIPNGWSCLFLQVLRAQSPGNSREFEMVRFLIQQRANLFAKDAFGLTIFDHVKTTLEKCPTGGYQQDLWHCALRREGIDTGPASEVHSREAKYDIEYTPKHYRALCYLDSWTNYNIFEKVHDTLEACPWTEDEISEISRIDAENQAETRRYWERRRQKRLLKESLERRRMDQMAREIAAWP